MNDDTGGKTLGALFREAAGDRESLTIDGDEYHLTICDGVIVNGRELSQLPAATVERAVRRLRDAAEHKYLDPANNDFIRIPD